MKETINITMNLHIRSLLLLPMLMTALLAGARQMRNPVWQRDWPDPTIWQGDDGRYYCK